MAEGHIAEKALEEAEEREDAAPASGDALAVAVAMDQVADDPSVAVEAAGFLRLQKKLVELQIHHFDQERELAIEAAKRKRFSDRLKYGFQAFPSLVAAVAVIGFSVMAWRAVNDHGLQIEPFSVPADLAQGGLTGQVLASQLLDQLVELDHQTNSQRAPSTYARSWGEDVKVEIPETGVSLQEVDRWLHESLGHQTKISGEITRTPTGLALTARTADEAGTRVEGGADTLDAMVRQEAEAIYERTQPYRYAVYLVQKLDFERGEAVFRREIASAPPKEAAWDYNGLGLLVTSRQGARQGVPLFQTAVRLDPTLSLPLGNLATYEDALGHAEAAFTAISQAVKVISRSDAGGVRPDMVKVRGTRDRARQLAMTGDFLAAAPMFDFVAHSGAAGTSGGAIEPWAEACVGAHDVACARRALATPDSSVSGPFGAEQTALNVIVSQAKIAVEAHDWAAVVALGEHAAALQREHPPLAERVRAQITPLLAYAAAKSGDQAKAAALIEATPNDCYGCLRMRGKLAALAKDWPAADRWFAEAARQAPSLPFADQDWGEMLLAKGDPVAASAKFRLAQKAGPHFADPLKGLGDVARLEGRPGEARTQYDKALKYAPAWLALRQARAALNKG